MNATASAPPRATSATKRPPEPLKLADFPTLIQEAITHLEHAWHADVADNDSYCDRMCRLTIAKAQGLLANMPTVRDLPEATFDIEAMTKAAIAFNKFTERESPLNTALRAIDRATDIVNGGGGGPPVAQAATRPITTAHAFDTNMSNALDIAQELLLWGTYEVDGLTQHLIDFVDDLHHDGTLENTQTMVLRGSLIRMITINGMVMQFLSEGDDYTLGELASKLHQHQRLRSMLEPEGGAA